MNLHQLKFVREAVRQNFNLTEAAKALFTSQPGVSKAIIELEDELGVRIFERHGKRIKGLTPPGEAVVQLVDRLMRDIDSLKRVGAEFATRSEGELTVACTHTQARYVLPRVLPGFKQRYPKVHLSLLQGSPRQLAQWVLSGQADLAIATEALAQTPGLVTLPCYHWEHVVVVPLGHELADQELTLQSLRHHPIVTYDRAFAGRTTIDVAFSDAGLRADIVLEAIDADVIKTYVELGMGVGIIAGVAFDPDRDQHLQALPAGHLFGGHTTRVGMREGAFLRDYVYEFIEALAPALTPAVVRKQVEQGGG